MSIDSAPKTTEPARAAHATDPVPAPAPAPLVTPAAAPLVPPRPATTDELIFRVSPAALSLVGGSGRGAGWMGIVDLPRASEPLAERVLATSKATHVDAAEPMRIVGPYWNVHAYLVPVGGDHLVVFGGSQPRSEERRVGYGCVGSMWAVSERR